MGQDRADQFILVALFRSVKDAIRENW
jgi:hypothetical protein